MLVVHSTEFKPQVNPAGASGVGGRLMGGGAEPGSGGLGLGSDEAGLGLGDGGSGAGREGTDGGGGTVQSLPDQPLVHVQV